MRIRKLVLQTVYLKTLEEFYSSILDLPVEAVNSNEILIKIGSTDLIFTETKGPEPFYHFAINIPANKIEEAKNWISNKLKLLWIDDYKSDVADFVNWHAKSVYFYDPAGNILELISRFDLKNEVDDSFSPKQLLSISEAGLVFSQNEFELRTTELLNNYSLRYFAKQSPLPQFRAVGDDEGLFIIVPEHRNWYPTEKPSGIFPMRVEFENDGNKYSFSVT